MKKSVILGLAMVALSSTFNLSARAQDKSAAPTQENVVDSTAAEKRVIITNEYGRFDVTDYAKSMEAKGFEIQTVQEGVYNRPNMKSSPMIEFESTIVKDGVKVTVTDRLQFYPSADKNVPATKYDAVYSNLKVMSLDGNRQYMNIYGYMNNMHIYEFNQRGGVAGVNYYNTTRSELDDFQTRVGQDPLAMAQRSDAAISANAQAIAGRGSIANSPDRNVSDFPSRPVDAPQRISYSLQQQPGGMK